jgi:hypothetical protein
LRASTNLPPANVVLYSPASSKRRSFGSEVIDFYQCGYRFKIVNTYNPTSGLGELDINGIFQILEFAVGKTVVAKGVLYYVTAEFRVFGSCLKTEITAAGIRCADHATPSIRKSWH